MVFKENIPLMTTSNTKDSSSVVKSVDVVEKDMIDSSNDAVDPIATKSGIKRPVDDCNKSDHDDQLLSDKFINDDPYTRIDVMKGRDRNLMITKDVPTSSLSTATTDLKVNNDGDENENNDEDNPLRNHDIEKSSNEIKSTTDCKDNDSCIDTTTILKQDDVPIIDLQRPIKRARTAYFLFVEDHRTEIQKEVCYQNIFF
jgi:hypothetical protein